MLVVFGANGRTGRAVVAEALAQGLKVRPVVRDDRDGRGLDRLIDVGEICYADADHPDSLPPVLEGATCVVSCINARCAGPHSPRYSDEAGAHIVRAAHAAGIEKMLHMSVVGSFRWSPNPLNRRSFRLDREVRILKEVPWTMMRVSCFFDEIIEGHVRPPDGRPPHRIVRSGRYSPASYRDIGRMVVDLLPHLIPNRTHYVGGPTVFTGEALELLVTPWREQAPGWLRRTSAGALPPGDVSVSPDTTRVSVATRPVDHLEDALAPGWTPPPLRRGPDPDAPVAPTAPPDLKLVPPPEVPPPPGSVDPGPHPTDEGRNIKVLREMGDTLRRVVHDQLAADAERLGVASAGFMLDFRSARPRRQGKVAEVHEGTLHELTGVRVRDAQGKQVHRGSVNFVFDKLADELHIWFERPDRQVPDAVWQSLDMGVQRRMAADDAWAADARVQAFASGHRQDSL